MTSAFNVDAQKRLLKSLQEAIFFPWEAFVIFLLFITIISLMEALFLFNLFSAHWVVFRGWFISLFLFGNCFQLILLKFPTIFYDTSLLEIFSYGSFLGQFSVAGFFFPLIYLTLPPTHTHTDFLTNVLEDFICYTKQLNFILEVMWVGHCKVVFQRFQQKVIEGLKEERLWAWRGVRGDWHNAREQLRAWAWTSTLKRMWGNKWLSIPVVI